MSSSIPPKTKLAVNLRIAVVQLNPQIAQVSQNVSRATTMLRKLKDTLDNSGTGKNLDLVVFPEFALTGYNFHSRDHILPYTSRAKDGPSFDLARLVSKMFSCYTVIGYPERVSTDADSKLYNSAILISPEGELVFNYRKSFLYNTDEDWNCQENPAGFQNFPLLFKGRGKDLSKGKEGNAVDVTLKTSIGICMDLSPYKFQAPFQDFEFATYNVDNNSELIICPMAWLHSSSVTSDLRKEEITEKVSKIEQHTRQQHLPAYGSQGDYQYDFDNRNITKRLSSDSDLLQKDYTDFAKPDMSNVNYWLLRFTPFLALRQRYLWSIEDLFPFLEKKRSASYMGSSIDGIWKFKNKNAIVVMANRCGIEDGTTVFAGSSGIYKFNGKFDNEEGHLDSENQSVELLGNLGKGVEGIIMRDVNFEVFRNVNEKCNQCIRR
ncbi:hypothetical protein HG535_0G05320 [Zygotorulaspora mrakii]|uniref:CN hydrolase domain-containing protein n=1 Tax=Zygotorulaspora mrakii TaxID=42260 RepID=A0A7H9B9F9_ZYGMR|nr:uncharacterized protein HG535_0G05320 [Zygotorulaspora mrakii]QLG74649.1 hypothetical protein HG535_0G05320 [Zygotorulaspora mrakii]